MTDAQMLADPTFHAQNAYAIVMRTLGRFEAALGRRVAWGCDGHQLHIAPHAFADANAFYARAQRAIFLGYFAGGDGSTVFTCLSHDVIAHETTHALLDGLRWRYLEPSCPDQGAFHEGFADIVALLSIFSLPEVVSAALDPGTSDGRIDAGKLTREALLDGVLFGLALQMGQEMSGVRGQALRRSAEIKPDRTLIDTPGYQEEHRRGELLVAPMMHAFLDIWISRLEKIGPVAEGASGKQDLKDRSIVVEQGAIVADHLLTMAIRAVDYCPPTDLTFSDFLCALLTVDREVVPDDTKYGYRKALLHNFAAFGVDPPADADRDGLWPRFDRELVYGRTHFDSMMNDKEEVFRFVWENREALEVDEPGYMEVQSVRPCVRIGPDGFMLRETVAEYVQIMTLTAGELEHALGIRPPPDMDRDYRLRMFGGGALIFDEYGRLKHHIANHLARSADDRSRQEKRLAYLWDSGAFDTPVDSGQRIAALHLARAQA
jgi:hypothetical protein